MMVLHVLLLVVPNMSYQMVSVSHMVVNMRMAGRCSDVQAGALACRDTAVENIKWSIGPNTKPFVKSRPRNKDRALDDFVMI